MNSYGGSRKFFHCTLHVLLACSNRGLEILDRACVGLDDLLEGREFGLHDLFGVFQFGELSNGEVKLGVLGRRRFDKVVLKRKAKVIKCKRLKYQLSLVVGLDGRNAFAQTLDLEVPCGEVLL